jgi:hypothetical protein
MAEQNIAARHKQRHAKPIPPVEAGARGKACTVKVRVRWSDPWHPAPWNATFTWICPTDRYYMHTQRNILPMFDLVMSRVGSTTSLPPSFRSSPKSGHQARRCNQSNNSATAAQQASPLLTPVNVLQVEAGLGQSRCGGAWASCPYQTPFANALAGSGSTGLQPLGRHPTSQLQLTSYRAFRDALCFAATMIKSVAENDGSKVSPKSVRTLAPVHQAYHRDLRSSQGREPPMRRSQQRRSAARSGPEH